MKILLVLSIMLSFQCMAQKSIQKDIKSFGAKGDGKSNDQAAFQKAADFFNKRGGNGTLIITKGTYIIGKQTFTAGKNGAPAYLGEDVLHFTRVTNLTIKGVKGAKLRYADGLKFGSFNPQTGASFEHAGSLYNYQYAAFIGHCIYLDQASDVSIQGLELDGNNANVVLGGVYGDVGRQLPHYGIFIKDSRDITVQNINAHHFALDGISVANKASTSRDKIQLLNCSFEYNSRQGLSWIGGNELVAKKCKFNHTGQGKFNSNPGAGVDIEAEVNTIRNGSFVDCEFIDNKGCGVLADSGDSGNCDFTNCTIWGLDAYSVWVNKPAFTFKDCKIYGSIVHGYDAANDQDATKFIHCSFEDKPYNGKEAAGKFLVESNNRRRVTFIDCSFTSNKKKLMWIQTSPNLNPEDKYQFTNCTFTMNNDNLAAKDYIAVIRGIQFKNCTFIYTSKDAKQKGYWLNDCCDHYNTDAGGNKTIYSQSAK